MFLVYLLTLLVLLVLFYLAVSKAARLAYARPDTHDRTYFVTTADGWRLALHRVLPSEPDPQKLPVILCHGLGANRFNFNFNKEYSLAHFLADRGYDAWVVELRGAGFSTNRNWLDPRRWDFGFADLVEQDIPAVISHVLEKTGQKKAHFVGHSMGAMISYVIGHNESSQHLASICAIAGPGSFSHLGEIGRLAFLKPLLKPFPVIHGEVLFGFFITLVGTWLPQAIKYDLNPDNMDNRTIREAGANLISPISRKLLLDFISFIQSGKFSGPDGREYAGNLDKIKTPIYLIAGSADLMASPESVEIVYKHVQVKDKAYRCFCKNNGDLADYGHGDILIGEAALQEVLPTIAAWLDKH